MEIEKVHTQMLYPCSGKKFQVLCALWVNTCSSRMCWLMDNSHRCHPSSQWLIYRGDIPAVAVRLQTGPLPGISAYVSLHHRKCLRYPGHIPGKIFLLSPPGHWKAL